MLAAERHARILEYLEHRERASVEQLATVLATSATTVRRDLTSLQRAGFLRRVHGGAVRGRRLPPTVPSPPTDDALARSIRRRLTPGDAVILVGPLVMPIVARQLAADPMRLIVVTNQLDVAQVLLGNSGIDVILLGGKLHPDGHTLPQPIGAADLKYLVAMKIFLEVEGVRHDVGITASAAEDARYKHDLLQHALQKTIVAPAGRWGLAFGHRVAKLSAVDCWITTPLSAAQREDIGDIPCEVEESR
jgi:DeoR/GlpR family transcriptional regulator of sugar metabolism